MNFQLFPSLKASKDGRRPLLLKARSSEVFILFTISIAIFTDIFLYAVVVPVLPFSLETRAGIQVDSIQRWIAILLACYAAGLLVFAPIWGWIADHIESRTLLFSFGLIALIGSTAMLCVGNSIGLVIAGRVLQGISSALVWSVGLAIVSDTVGADRVGEAMGWVTLSMVLAILLGPMLGGITFERGGYYAVWAMCFALLVFDCVLRLVMIEKKWARHYGLEETEVFDGPSETTVEKALPSEARTTGTEVAQDPERSTERHRKYNFSLLSLLRVPRLLVAFWACFVHGVLLTSFDSVLPLFVSQTFRWDALGAGLIFLALCIPSFSEPLVGKLADRWGPRYLATTGLICVTPFYVLLRFVTQNTIEQKVLLCALLALIGFNLSLILPPMMAEINRVVVLVEKRNPGMFGQKGAFAQAYALFNVAYAGGILVGPIWGGYVIEGSGWSTLGWSLGLLSGVSAIPTYLYAGGEVWRKGTARNQSTSSNT